MAGAPPHGPCPWLELEEPGQAVCGMVRAMPNLAKAFGIGAGCCIKARAYRGDKIYSFADLPPETKALLGYEKHKRQTVERG